MKTELVSLKEAKRDEEMTQIQLQQELAALTEELTKEKVTQGGTFFLDSVQNHLKPRLTPSSFLQALVDSLSVLVEQEREESEERLRQLKEEMEEVLGELAVLEEQEQGRQETFQRLQEENIELEGQLSSTRALLER